MLFKVYFELNITKSLFRQQFCKEFRDVAAEFGICQSTEHELTK